MHSSIDLLVGWYHYQVPYHDFVCHRLAINCFFDLRSGLDLRWGQDHWFQAGLVSISATSRRIKGSVSLYDSSITRQGNRIIRSTLEPSSQAEGWGLVSTSLLSLRFQWNLSPNRGLGLVLPSSGLDSPFDIMEAEPVTSGAVRTLSLLQIRFVRKGRCSFVLNVRQGRVRIALLFCRKQILTSRNIESYSARPEEVGVYCTEVSWLATFRS